MVSDEYSGRTDPPRMWIDKLPPPAPASGDVWIRFGELRTWNGKGWDPPWVPPPKPKVKIKIPPHYPKVGRRKG